MESGENSFFNNRSLLVFLYKYKRFFILSAILSFVLSLMVSYLIEDKYQSTAVIFPTNSSSIRSLLDLNSASRSIVDFGEEEKSEQLLEVLHSERIKNKIITDFDLLHHYKINQKQSITPIYDLHKKFNANFSFKKNKNMAVEIEVLDHNPDTSALMAKAVLKALDEVMDEIHKKRALQGFKIVVNKYDKLQKEVLETQDSLQKIMALGILDVSAQTESYTNAYTEALAKNNTKLATEMQDKLNFLAKNANKFKNLRVRLEYDTERLAELKTLYEKAQTDAEEAMDNFFTVTNPYPAEKKSYPIRWLIVVLSVLGTFIVGLLSLIVFEEIQKVRANMPKL